MRTDRKKDLDKYYNDHLKLAHHAKAHAGEELERDQGHPVRGL